MTSPDSDVPPDIDSSRLRGDLPLRPVAGLRGSLSTTDAARGSARAREAQYPCPDSSLEHGAAVEAPLAASSRPCLVEGQPAVDSGPPEASDKAGEAEGRSRRFRALAKEVRRTCWMSLTYSWLNVLLVFVPLGIIVAKVGNVPGGVVFATNCIAVVPLAGMLSFATESVARNMGDSLGALLNVTFGNAVEMIIFMYVFAWYSRKAHLASVPWPWPFCRKKWKSWPPGLRQKDPSSVVPAHLLSTVSLIISMMILPVFDALTQSLLLGLSSIALVKNQIRIVQASLLGSILANLLLILGMGFFLGGLRYREQIYNSTVTQMSACLLSLSVISLVLPTAFHASFNNTDRADAQSLKISRGTSVILLLVYVIYLLFQLKSHAYMYESTPQHIVDAESIPGPAAAWLDSSSSDDSSSSGSDSDSSSRSRDTMRRRMKKVLRGGRRRKSSTDSADTAETGAARAASINTAAGSPGMEAGQEEWPSHASENLALPGMEPDGTGVVDEKENKKKKVRHNGGRNGRQKGPKKGEAGDCNGIVPRSGRGRGKDAGDGGGGTLEDGEPRRVDFAVLDEEATGTRDEGRCEAPEAAPRRPLPMLRGMSVKNLAPKVFVSRPDPAAMGGMAMTSMAAAGPVPRVRYGIRRTNSLPDRLDGQGQLRAPGGMLPSNVPAMSLANGNAAGGIMATGEGREEEHLSRVASIMLLMVTTALVAVCAEFLINSIEEVTRTSSVGEVFIGLIILPIVGNAAEHVTAITVAMKNKMDLAIGVAVGSSIQIALFVTPLVVILGWIIGRDMTLYFTLFETVCLFVSAFMVNFLVLDGRSNYLEGALLCAVYCIIGIAAFFFPQSKDASQWGG